MINFKNIHTTLKNLIVAKGFTYVPSDKWFNFEYGIFPAGTHNNGYTIRPSSARKTEKYEADDWSDSPWTVEFCLSGVNDTYLGKIGKALDAIRNLEGNTGANIVQIEFAGWNIEHYDKHVILTFDIALTINE